MEERLVHKQHADGTTWLMLNNQVVISERSISTTRKNHLSKNRHSTRLAMRWASDEPQRNTGCEVQIGGIQKKPSTRDLCPSQVPGFIEGESLEYTRTAREWGPYVTPG